jgi:transcriptional regulator with XRE-family HTH domain
MTLTLGMRIRQLREQHDLSLRELAKKLDDVSAAHLLDIELGRRFPSPALLRKIASALRVEVAELQQLDTRAPVEELKRRAAADPAFGFALRQLGNMSSEEILDLLEKREAKKNK